MSLVVIYVAAGFVAAFIVLIALAAHGHGKLCRLFRERNMVDELRGFNSGTRNLSITGADLYNERAKTRQKFLTTPIENDPELNKWRRFYRVVRWTFLIFFAVAVVVSVAVSPLARKVYS